MTARVPRHLWLAEPLAHRHFDFARYRQLAIPDRKNAGGVHHDAGSSHFPYRARYYRGGHGRRVRRRAVVRAAKRVLRCECTEGSARRCATAGHEALLHQEHGVCDGVAAGLCCGCPRDRRQCHSADSPARSYERACSRVLHPVVPLSQAHPQPQEAGGVDHRPHPQGGDDRRARPAEARTFDMGGAAGGRHRPHAGHRPTRLLHRHARPRAHPPRFRWRG